MFMICEYGSNHFFYHIAMDVDLFQNVFTLYPKTLNAKMVLAIFSNKSIYFHSQKIFDMNLFQANDWFLQIFYVHASEC